MFKKQYVDQKQELLNILSEALNEIHQIENESNKNQDLGASFLTPFEKFLPIVVHGKALMAQLNSDCEHMIEKEKKIIKKELIDNLKQFTKKLKNGEIFATTKGKVSDGAAKTINSEHDPYVVLLNALKDIQKKQKNKKIKVDIGSIKRKQSKTIIYTKTNPEISLNKDTDAQYKLDDEHIDKFSKQHIESKEDLISDSSQLSYDQIDAFNTYTDSESVNINRYLRGIEVLGGMNEKVVKKMKDVLDRSRLSQDMILYRGASKVALGKYRDLNPEELLGKIIIDPAFVSTTQNFEIVKTTHLDGDLIMTIHAKKGAQALDISSISKFEEEKEVIFNTYQKMLIISSKYEKGLKIDEELLHITVLIK